jgi:hypothetical protein
MKLMVYSGLLALLLLSGCSTDFDVIAPYKEVIVVDGLLNKADTVQYIKVSKAFLGEGNALVMAQQKDSFNYADVLTVKLTEVGSANVYYFTRIESNDKDSGTFAYPFNVLYRGIVPINQDKQYKLEVTNTSTNVTATSTTKIVGEIVFSPAIPVTVDLSLSTVQPTFFITYFIGNNSKVHEARLRFHYRDIDPSGNSTDQMIDWNLGGPSSLIGTTAKYVFTKADFFSMLGRSIPDKPGYTRRIDSLNVPNPVEFVFVEGSEDLQTYIELNKPTTGIVQDRPIFTTVENGIGLFTSRLIHSEFRTISLNTQLSLDTSSYTQSKNFEF